MYFLQNSGEQKLQSLLKQYNSIPYLPKKRDFEVERYVAAHLTVQLQMRLQVYEKRIRTSESARVTDLLRKVFYEYGNEAP